VLERSGSPDLGLAELGDEGDEVPDDVERGVAGRVGRHGGVAVAAEVGRHGAVPPRRQGCHLVAPPVPEVGEAVQEKHRGAALGPRFRHVQAHPVHLHRPVPHPFRRRRRSHLSPRGRNFCLALAGWVLADCERDLPGIGMDQWTAEAAIDQK
jgi:hypothetical protein